MSSKNNILDIKNQINKIIFYLLMSNIFTLATGIIIDLYKNLSKPGIDPNVQGWGFIFSPIIVGIFLFPSAISFLVLRFNLEKDKIWLRFLILFFSILSLIMSFGWSLSIWILISMLITIFCIFFCVKAIYESIRNTK